MLAKVVNFPGRRANTNAAIELTNTISMTETTVRIVELMNALITTPSFVPSTVFIFFQRRNFSPNWKLNWNDSLEFFVAVRNINIKGAAKMKSPTGIATKSNQYLRRIFFMPASPSY
jgi:hypothetical protein